MTQKNFVGEWFDVQKRVFDFWQESMNIKPKDTVDIKPINLFEESIKAFQEIINKSIVFSNIIYTPNINNAKYAYPQQEIINKLFRNVSLYRNLNQYWEDLTLNITEKESDLLSFYPKWNDYYMKMLSNNFVSLLPGQLKNYFNETLDIYTMSAATTNNFSKPWLDEAHNMQNLLLISMSGDPRAYIDFNRIWRKNFSYSFGKLFNIPQLLINGEQIQKQMHTFNSLINYINYMNEFDAIIVKVNQETSEKIIIDYNEMLIVGTNPKTYKEFYEYWWKQNEAAYLKLFGTPEFSKLLAQVLEAKVNFKKDLDDLLEKQLAFLPYPSKTDMESVYKTLDTLKREIRSLKKEAAAAKHGKSNGVISSNVEQKSKEV
jgi:hypothetical protein